MNATRSMRTLGVSWAVQGIGWFALAETAARIVLEGLFCLALFIAGMPLLPLFAAWLCFHTIAWLWIFGGYGKLWTVLGVRTDPERLRAYVNMLTAKLARTVRFEAVYLRGSVAGGRITETSDVDLIVIPARPYVRSLLALWGLRLSAVLRRMPLEAVSMDAVREIPFRMGGATPLSVKPPPLETRWEQRLKTRGILVTASGIDGSGKTTVVKDLVEELRRRGLDAVYFYAHRQTYREEAVRPTLTIAFRSLWIRTGHKIDTLRVHPAAKFFFDAFTTLDYLAIRMRLREILRPGRVVVTDRYVADVIVYLRSLGPVHRSIEGLLTAIAPQPDVSLFFEIPPDRAFERKPERSLAELEGFVRDYADIRRFIDVTPVDASAPAKNVVLQITDTLSRVLGMPMWISAERLLPIPGARAAKQV